MFAHRFPASTLVIASYLLSDARERLRGWLRADEALQDLLIVDAGDDLEGVHGLKNHPLRQILIERTMRIGPVKV